MLKAAGQGGRAVRSCADLRDGRRKSWVEDCCWEWRSSWESWPQVMGLKPLQESRVRRCRRAPGSPSHLGGPNGEPTLRAEGRGVKFFKRVGRDRVLIRVEVAGDRVEVEANTKGIVRVDRNGKLLRLQIQGQFKTALARIQKLTSGSAALDGLENLAAALEGQNHPEARSVMTSYALLHALRGSAGPSRSAWRAPPRRRRRPVSSRRWRPWRRTRRRAGRSMPRP